MRAVQRAVVIAAAVVVAAGCGGSRGGRSGERGRPGGSAAAPPPVASAAARAALGQVTYVGRETVRPGRPLVRPLPSPWAVSLDVQPASGSVVRIELGSRHLALRGGGHLEATAARLTLDGRPLRPAPGGGKGLRVRTTRGRAVVSTLIISDPADLGSLLLHRLAELHARLAGGQFPIGADVRDRLHLSATYWTSGFWPGALWEASALAPAGNIFGRWALAATLSHFGHERDDTHDVGFMYGQSSLAAWEALCRAGSRAGRRPLCARLRRSVLSAAGELLALAASNRRAGTIPTSSAGSRADTIVDSMMNITILPWATSVTGDRAYRRVAERHARRVAALLVRRDGSTIQAVNFDRASGRILSFSTHQGISSRSTWSRGEGWALYGFAEAAAQLRDEALLRVAERIADYVRRHLPADGVPRWDYEAPAGAPLDTSAGAITAAGLLHLAHACTLLDRRCAAARGWVTLSRRMLAATLRFAGQAPPLGLLRGQVLNERAHGCWCNGGELMFGVSYALEALQLGRRL